MGYICPAPRSNNDALLKFAGKAKEAVAEFKEALENIPTSLGIELSDAYEMDESVGIFTIMFWVTFARLQDQTTMPIEPLLEILGPSLIHGKSLSAVSRVGMEVSLPLGKGKERSEDGGE